MSPFASEMPAVDAVSVSPTRAVPEIVGAPVAAALAGCATVFVTTTGPKSATARLSASCSFVSSAGCA